MLFIRSFSPLSINGLSLKNRFVMPAIHHLYTPEGVATERFNEYYWKKAEGGVGLIIVGGCRFDDFGAPYAMMSLQYDEMIPGWKTFVDGVHARGAKVAVQLYHAGRYTKQNIVPPGESALAPSAVFSTYTKETPKAMTKDEIDAVIRQWAAAAGRAKKAGFDAVEILGSAGYLISQFLSPVTNLREDEYGGSWENRCRFALEVIAAVRAEVGTDYPLIMRTAGNDFMKGSNTNVEAVEFAKEIEKAGIDMINVTGGWHETTVPQLPGDVPKAGFSYLAAAIKNAVSVPVMVSNRMNDPFLAEEVLALGRGDLIGLGRTLIADPDWVNKVKEGRLDEIRPCVACNQGCLAKTFFANPIECLVNANAGKEYLCKDAAPVAPKNLLVIGGGPSGSEFAIRAAEMGHKVTLWEKDAQIGGQLYQVAAPPGKDGFANLVRYYQNMLKKHQVNVVVHKEATEEDVLAGKFDAVVFGTGAIPKVIPMPDAEGKMMIVAAADVLSGKVIPGKNVVIVGGGSVGCETAQYLAHKGSISPEQLYFLSAHKAETPEKIQSLLNTSDRKVTIVEILKSIGAGFEPGTGWPILKDLKRMGVAQHVLSRIVSVTSDKVILEKTKEGGSEMIEIPCDTIVLAVGSRSNNALYEALKDKIPNVYIMGDAQKIGKIFDAVRDANTLATDI